MREPRVLSATNGAQAEPASPMTVAEGKPAPDFALTTDDGPTVKLSGLRGKPVVLYFYLAQGRLART